MAVSQQPWPAVAAGTEAARPVSDLATSVVRLLLVHGDEIAMARLAEELEPLRHLVVAASSPEAAVDRLGTHALDAIILFSESGELALDGARQIREATDLPLIIVGPDATAESRVGAFDHGAEDYIAQPVYPAELDRRVRVLVRRDRIRRRSDELTGPSGLLMHVRSHELFVGEEPISLTPKEFSILQLLLERRGEVVAPDQFSLHIWGYETFGSRNYVEAHISRLRGKLTAAGVRGAIKTVRGVGYVVR